MDDKLLTIEEAAQFLTVKTSTLRSAVFRRKIAFVKIGRLVRFKLYDLKVYVSKNTREAIM